MPLSTAFLINGTINNRILTNRMSFNKEKVNNIDNDNIINDQISTIQPPKEDDNIAKEQGKGNFDDQTKQIYALFREIRDDIKGIRDELTDVHLRIDDLEKKENRSRSQSPNKRVTFYETEKSKANNNNDTSKGKDRETYNTTRQENNFFGNVNNRGTISNYNRERRNAPRKYDQQLNFYNKRDAMSSDRTISEEYNINKLRKQEETPLAQKSIISNSNNREISELKDMLKNKDDKLNNLSQKVESVLLMLAGNTPTNKEC